MSKQEYNASNIKVLEGLEAVRKRPGMYIGSTDSRGLHHLIWEILDNAIDEVMAGYANKILVTLHKNNTVSIYDNGRGIPVDTNPTTKLSGVETIFTVLHAGGKFDDLAYKTAGGLHGVGSAVVNALSEHLTCIVYKDKNIYETKFKNGGNIEINTHIIGTTNKKGTLITFKPDDTIFNNLNFNSETIIQRIRESAFLFKSLEIEFIDEINNNHEKFLFNNGISEYVEYITKNKSIITPVIYFQDKHNDIEVEIAYQHTNEENEIFLSFANSIKTIEGGSHENGFKTSLVNSVNNHARKLKILKEKEKNFDAEDIREGVVAIISVKIPEKWINYEGQTKNKLFTPEAFEAVKKISDKYIELWLDKNKKEAIKIIEQAKLCRDQRLAAKKSKELVRKVKNKDIDRIISSKLTPAQQKDPKNNELFLVEGDSAGGSAKLGRNKKYQAILPLRGKVINVEKTKLSEALKNEEVSTIINCLGCGFGKNFDISKLKYHKVIIMTDADVDGSHIQALLLTMFYRFLRPLIENGHIYLALPPLYKLTNKSNPKQFVYIWDEVELEKNKNKYKSFELQRYKGLGEMNSDQLWDTTMNPETRILLQVNIDDIIACEKQVCTLMGDDVNERKDWINKNVNFNYDE